MACFICISLVFLVLLLTLIRLARRRHSKTIGFFHPYCNAGGGGERVLWTAIQAVQHSFPDYQIVVYTGDTDATPEQILSSVEKRFQILLKNVQFVYLVSRPVVEARYYPVFTLLLQSLASIVVAFEANLKYNPDIVIDSMGYAFGLVVFKLLGGCRTASYVHYPTISTDMLEKVRSGVEAHNNRSTISRSLVLTAGKLFYYRAFAALYGFIGRYFSDVTMVNSSWTRGHIEALWGGKPCLVFPPCEVDELVQLKRQPSGEGTVRILSLAQFRPEKNHDLQIEVMEAWRRQMSESEFVRNIRLVLVGSCRNEEDRNRVAALKNKCVQLDLGAVVEFHLDISWDDLKQEMRQCDSAIHSMWNEHFGISVVECMAAGLLTVAHKSGGPLMDIIDSQSPPVGFLADSVETYVEEFEKIRGMRREEKEKIAEAARLSVNRFSSKAFKDSFIDAIRPIFS